MLLLNIKNKKIINSLYDDRYNDIQTRGKYFLVWDKPTVINLLYRTSISFNDSFQYEAPVEVPIINSIFSMLYFVIKQFKH